MGHIKEENLGLLDYLLDQHDYAMLVKLLQKEGAPASLQAFARLGQALVQGNLAVIDKLAQELDQDQLLRPEALEQATYAAYRALQIQLKRQEYGDYFRALTPILVNIFRLIFEKRVMPQLDQFIEPIKKEDIDGRHLYRGLQWKQSRVEASDNIVNQTFHRYYGDHFNYDQYLSSSHLLKLITDHSQDKDLVAKATRMRAVEKYVRNLSAHEVVFVDQAWVKERGQLSLEEINHLLGELMTLADLKDQDQLNALSKINKEIKQGLGV
ncbi:hypothetical protein [Eremococcus coleocola]|uniref:hypothetical protein n=1 Tax=Eremococcus coleocola TaxID=88132 RepID=UPI0003FD6CD4|nr:hypothetical protein [Eremococcus coleocola]